MNFDQLGQENEELKKGEKITEAVESLKKMLEALSSFIRFMNEASGPDRFRTRIFYNEKIMPIIIEELEKLELKTLKPKIVKMFSTYGLINEGVYISDKEIPREKILSAIDMIDTTINALNDIN